MAILLFSIDGYGRIDFHVDPWRDAQLMSRNKVPHLCVAQAMLYEVFDRRVFVCHGLNLSNALFDREGVQLHSGIAHEQNCPLAQAVFIDFRVCDNQVPLALFGQGPFGGLKPRGVFGYELLRLDLDIDAIAVGILDEEVGRVLAAFFQLNVDGLMNYVCHHWTGQCGHDKSALEVGFVMNRVVQ